MFFVHRRTLRKGRAIAATANFLGFSFFLGLATYLVFFQESSSGSWFGKAIFALSAVTLPLVIWWFVRLFKGKGEWHIQISETELFWLVPEGIGENNLNLPISKISKVVCESSLNIDTHDYYYIETVGGERHPIHPSASGISLSKFLSALESLGVKCEARHAP